MTRLEKFYKDEVVPKLMKQFGYTNPMEVPKLTKITLNMGVGEAAANKKILENAVADMAKISGQKPLVTKSRISVASFKIRDGWPIGCKVTLRRAAYFFTVSRRFLSRLTTAVFAMWYFPRSRLVSAQFLNGKRKASSRALASASVFAVVVIAMSMPRMASTWSKSISGKMICSLTPML